MNDRIRIGVLGASGYTGADLVRLALLHPRMEITALTANTHAGKTMAEVFPHFSFVDLPRLTTVDDADWGSVDAVFCGLPHGTTQEITRSVLAKHPKVKFIDMSADFRLRDPDTYKTWYGHDHMAHGPPGRGRLRAHRALPDGDPRCAARRLPRLLPDRDAARAPAARLERPDRRRATSSSTPSPACPAPAAA